jgi:hypothetical protein
VSNQVQQTSAHEALIAAGATPVGNLTADDWMIAKRQPYYLTTLRADRRDAEIVAACAQVLYPSNASGARSYRRYIASFGLTGDDRVAVYSI